jgi:outer membrane lipopolysaccharide assembly protein LptE/RlpB
VERIRLISFKSISGLLALIFLSGCGYGLRGSVNNLPPDIKAVSIPAFVNATIEPGVEIIFANALVYEFNRSGILKVVSESMAQAQVKGKIISIAVDPVTLANQTQALQRRVIVTLEVSLQRTDDQKILWKNPRLSRDEVYSVTTDPNQTQRNKEEAIKKISQDLSERIHNAILENF